MTPTTPPIANRSPERLVFFSDAVVAIALTLLILPLTEAVPEAVAGHLDALEMVRENQWKIYSFLLSFVVIARLWVAHHRLFEQVKAYSYPLMVMNLAWLLTIVILPFPTEMVGGFDDDRFTVGLYIGAVLAGTLCQFVMTLIIRADPAVSKGDNGTLDRLRFTAAVNSGLLLAALLLSALIPGVGYLALLLLVLISPINRLRSSRSAAQVPAGGA
jgi:uncharacterized membrane protein